MKKTIITIALLSIISLTGVLAQQKGDNLIGINLGFGSNNTEFSNYGSTREGNFFLYGVGYTYFFKENRGFRANFSTFKSNSESNSNSNFDSKNESKSRFYKIDYYVLFPLSKALFVSVSPGLSYQNSSFENINIGFDSKEEIKLRNSNANLSAGLFWLPFKKIGFSMDFSLVNLTFQKITSDRTSSNPQVQPELITDKNYSFNFSTQNLSQNQAITIFYKF